jgi:large subunit ribosomal protein L17
MRHGYKKFKFQFGKDANDMLLRKLAVNFVTHGTMVTTEKKAKALDMYLSKLIEKSKEQTEANKNYLLHHFGSVAMVNTMFEKVGPVMKEVHGGYVNMKRMQQRYSDGAMMVQVTWSKPVVVKEPPVEAETGKKASAKVEAVKTTEAAQAVEPKAEETKKTRSVKKTK